MVISGRRREISEGVFYGALRTTGSLVFGVWGGGWHLMAHKWTEIGFGGSFAERPRLSPRRGASVGLRECARGPCAMLQACRANSISPDLAMLIAGQLCSDDVQIDIITVPPPLSASHGCRP